MNKSKLIDGIMGKPWPFVERVCSTMAGYKSYSNAGRCIDIEIDGQIVTIHDQPHRNYMVI